MDKDKKKWQEQLTAEPESHEEYSERMKKLMSEPVNKHPLPPTYLEEVPTTSVRYYESRMKALEFALFQARSDLKRELQKNQTLKGIILSYEHMAESK